MRSSSSKLKICAKQPKVDEHLAGQDSQLHPSTRHNRSFGHPYVLPARQHAQGFGSRQELSQLTGLGQQESMDCLLRQAVKMSSSWFLLWVVASVDNVHVRLFCVAQDPSFHWNFCILWIGGVLDRSYQCNRHIKTKKYKTRKNEEKRGKNSIVYCVNVVC